MSWWNNLFSWKTEQHVERSKRESRRPQNSDKSESLVANKELTKGLYHNTYPGLKFAGSLAYAPIALPVMFMGIPTPSFGDDELSKKLIEMFGRKMVNIHIQCHREGTIWIYPKFSKQTQSVIWEFISDDTVSDIIKDIDTNEIIEIWTDENLKIKTKYNETKNVRRVRQFTKDKITIKYFGAENIANKSEITYRNVLKILPICFANNQDGDDIRGHSDYERILTDLKSYHDIDYAGDVMLAKFKIKMLLGVNDPSTWMSNNGFSSVNDIDIADSDIYFYLKDKEDPPEFVFPEGAVEAYDTTLKRKYRKLVQGSVVPEIWWGLKTEGNHASIEEQMAVGVMFVKDKQKQKNDAYKKLWAATLELLNLGTFNETNLDKLEIKWNDLDSVSDKSKAEIFGLYAGGISTLINSAGISKDQLYNLYKEFFPKITKQKFEEWLIGISDMAGHKQFTSSSYTDNMMFTNDKSGISGGVSAGS